MRSFDQVREVLLFVEAGKLLLVYRLPLGLGPLYLRVHLLFVHVVRQLSLSSLLSQMKISMRRRLIDLSLHFMRMVNLLFRELLDVIGAVVGGIEAEARDLDATCVSKSFKPPL